MTDPFVKPTPARPGWVVPVVAGLAVLVLALASIAVWAITRASAPSAANPIATSSGPLVISGSLTLKDSSGVLNLDDTACSGMHGYDDIRRGTQVVVTDQSGTVLGTGELGAGVLQNPGLLRTCRFAFTVLVPPGKPFYSIEVSHRGKLTHSAAEVTGQQVELTLG